MNGIICIFKPSDYTSFDVVAIMRKVFGTKKVGHGGTLDPMATGILPIFIGNATKAVDFQPEVKPAKEYVAGFRLGMTTDTQDITGTIIRKAEDGFMITREQLEAVAKCHTGDISQTPPMYSAVKVNGQKLCDLARKGKTVERSPRPVSIYELSIKDYNQDKNEGVMRIACSKGTYVRTLIHDIGMELKVGGVMTSLLRTRSGAFTLDDCHELDKLREATREELQDLLMPLDRLYESYPKISLDEEQTKLFGYGVALSYNYSSDNLFAVYDCSSRLVALARTERDNTLKIIQRFKV